MSEYKICYWDSETRTTKVRPATASEVAEVESRKNTIVVPNVVTMKQARKALILGGISIASVDAAINAIEDDQERELAITDWEYSQTVRRDSSLVVSMAAALNLTSMQVDSLFTSAAGISE